MNLSTKVEIHVDQKVYGPDVTVVDATNHAVMELDTAGSDFLPILVVYSKTHPITEEEVMTPAMTSFLLTSDFCSEAHGQHARLCFPVTNGWSYGIVVGSLKHDAAKRRLNLRITFHPRRLFTEDHFFLVDRLLTDPAAIEITCFTTTNPIIIEARGNVAAGPGKGWGMCFDVPAAGLPASPYPVRFSTGVTSSRTRRSPKWS